MQHTTAPGKPADSSSITPLPEQDPEAVVESEQPTISEPGGFANDPNDATNPNEEIERFKEKLRPTTLRQ